MPKLLSIFLVFFALIAVSVSQVLAAVTVTQIAGEAVTTPLSTWSTSTLNPTIIGTAEPSALVTVTVDTIQAVVQANSSGAWQFVPTTLSELGAYDIMATSGDASVSFTLTITDEADDMGDLYTGPTDDTSGTAVATTTGTKGGNSETTPDELPKTGANDIWWLLSGGIFFLISGGASHLVAKELKRIE